MCVFAHAIENHPKYAITPVSTVVCAGLELIFFVQTDEYIRGWTADEGGLQVVVHPYNTMPFPDDEGFAVGGGSSTFVSMRMVSLWNTIPQCLLSHQSPVTTSLNLLTS